MSNTQATITNTPNHNCRLVIRFRTDKNGKRYAESCGRMNNRGMWGRWIRVSLTDAEMWIAQDLADRA